MNLIPILNDYIEKWLGPQELKLELKNRLENLCALSGTPMSPDLHQWVTEKFGLEMTRVIEDYSTFTSPKLSPELLSVVDRIVPSNYQGEDVNLYFRQLFDVGCRPPDCLYFGTNLAPNLGTACGNTWEIDNTYFIFNSYEWEVGFMLQNQYSFESGGFTTNYTLNSTKVWTRQNSIPTNWQVQYGCDFNYYPVTFNLLSCNLDVGCYKLILNGVGVLLDYMTFNFGSSTEQVTLLGFTSSDSQFVQILQGLFGGNTMISVVDDGVKTVIDINNAYLEISPISLTTFGSGTINFTQVTC